MSLILSQCPLVRKIKEGEVPGYYMCQVQTLLEVLDLERAHFVQYRPEGMWGAMEFSVVDVPRDRAWFDRYKTDMLSFIATLQQYQLAPSPFVPEPEALSPASLASDSGSSKRKTRPTQTHGSTRTSRRALDTKAICLIQDDHDVMQFVPVAWPTAGAGAGAGASPEALPGESPEASLLALPETGRAVDGTAGLGLAGDSIVNSVDDPVDDPVDGPA